MSCLDRDCLWRGDIIQGVLNGVDVGRLRARGYKTLDYIKEAYEPEYPVAGNAIVPLMPSRAFQILEALIEMCHQKWQ
jgi:hypothetical protein